MVEPVSLTVGALAAALVSKAAEKAVEKVGEDAGEAGVGALARFARWLRERVSGHQEPSAALARVEDVPDSPSRVKALGVALDRFAEQDPGFGEQLRRQVQQARDAGVDVKVITQTALGDQNVQVADVEGSTVSVSYGTGHPRPSQPRPGRP